MSSFWVIGAECITDRNPLTILVFVDSIMDTGVSMRDPVFRPPDSNAVGGALFEIPAVPRKRVRRVVGRRVQRGVGRRAMAVDDG